MIPCTDSDSSTEPFIAAQIKAPASTVTDNNSAGTSDSTQRQENPVTTPHTLKRNPLPASGIRIVSSELLDLEDQLQKVPDELLRVLPRCTSAAEALESLTHSCNLPEKVIIQTIKKLVASEPAEKAPKNDKKPATLNSESPIVQICEAIFSGNHLLAAKPHVSLLFGKQAKLVETCFNRYTLERLRQFSSRVFAEASFSDPAAAAEILAEKPAGSAKGRMKAPEGIPTYLKDLYLTPLLTVPQEQHLFRKFNYFRHLIVKELNTLNESNYKYRELLPALNYMQKAQRVKNEIAQANLRLVVSVAKKFGTTGTDFFDRISTGNTGLLNGVDLFDYTRTYKDKKTGVDTRIRFSTYATRAIMTSIIREFKKSSQYTSRFHTQLLDSRSDSDDISILKNASKLNHNDALPDLTRTQLHFKSIKDALFFLLEEREARVLSLRLGMETGKVETLEDTAALLASEYGKVTKERIRQIETKALLKARVTACCGRLPFDIASNGKPYLDPTTDILEHFNPALVQVAWSITNNLTAQNIARSIGEIKTDFDASLEPLVEQAIQLLESNKLIKKCFGRTLSFKAR